MKVIRPFKKKESNKRKRGADFEDRKQAFGPIKEDTMRIIVRWGLVDTVVVETKVGTDSFHKIIQMILDDKK